MQRRGEGGPGRRSGYLLGSTWLGCGTKGHCVGNDMTAGGSHTLVFVTWRHANSAVVADWRALMTSDVLCDGSLFSNNTAGFSKLWQSMTQNSEFTPFLIPWLLLNIKLLECNVAATAYHSKEDWCFLVPVLVLRTNKYLWKVKWPKNFIERGYPLELHSVLVFLRSLTNCGLACRSWCPCCSEFFTFRTLFPPLCTVRTLSNLASH